MSLVLGFKKGDVVYLAADTQSTRDEDKYNITTRSNLKIHKLESGLIIAWVGEVSTEQALLAHPEWFEFNTKKGLNKKDITTKMVYKIFNGLKEQGKLIKKEDDVYKMEGTFLLAYKDKLYQVCSRFAVMRYDDYQAIGSGALAASYATMKIDRNKDINEQLLNILKISEKHTNIVSSPFVFINTRDLEFEVWRG